MSETIQQKEIRESRPWIGRTIFESGLIIVGIVLGFLVNEWREDLERAQQRDLALDRIIQELQLNREAVARVLPYHEKVAKKLRALLDNPPSKPFIDTFLQDVATAGVGDLVLQDTAWKTASARDSLATLDFGTVQQLSDVYDLAESGPLFAQLKIFEAFAEPQMYAPDQNGYLLKRAVFSFETIAMQERFLLQRYDEVLGLLLSDRKPAGGE